MTTTTKINLELSSQLYNELTNWKHARNTLLHFFKKNYEDNNFETLIIKVCLLNSLYKTNIKSEIHITECISKIPNLYEKIKQGDPESINLITNCSESKLFSFATKFCHFHEPDKFPIFDKYVSLSLSILIGWKETKEANAFFHAINSFKHKYQLNATYDELDSFLWIYGIKKTFENNDFKINNEVKKLINNKKEMFDNLVFDNLVS